MFGHGHAGGGRDDGDGGRDIEGAEPVPAGAADIQDFAGPRRGIKRRPDRLLAQFARECRDLFDRFALARERREEVRLGFNGNALINELRDRGAHLRVGQGAALRQPLGQGFQHEPGAYRIEVTRAKRELNAREGIFLCTFATFTGTFPT